MSNKVDILTEFMLIGVLKEVPKDIAPLFKFRFVAFTLLAHVKSRVSSEGTYYASNQEVADIIHATASSVSKASKLLEHYGFFERVVQRSKGGSFWRLNPDVKFEKRRMIKETKDLVDLKTGDIVQREYNHQQSKDLKKALGEYSGKVLGGTEEFMMLLINRVEKSVISQHHNK